MTRWLVLGACGAAVALFFARDDASGPERSGARTALESERPASEARWPASLDDPDPDRRREAAVALRDRGDEAVAVFIALLRHGDHEQQVLAARSLGRMRRGDRALLEALDPANPALCLEILALFGRTGGPKSDRWALPLLAVAELRSPTLQVLEARDPEVVQAVADLIDPVRGSEIDQFALRALGHAAGGVPQILAAFENRALLVDAIEAVERLGPHASVATPALIAVIREHEREEEEARKDLNTLFTTGSGGSYPEYDAGRALVAIGPSAIPQLLAMLADDLAGVRAHATDILASLGDAALPALQAAARDSSAPTRAAAVRALRSFAANHPDLLPLVAELARDPAREARLAALRALGAFDQAAVPVLIANLAATDVETLDATLDALRAIEVKDAAIVPRLSRLLTHEEHTLSWAAADVLGKMGAAAGDGIDALVRALDGADAYLRSSIADALVDIGAASIPVLVARVDRAPPAAQAAALDVLDKLEASETASRAAAERLLRSASGGVRVRAAHFLARFDQHQEVLLATLRAALEQDDIQLRRIAVDGLERLGTAAHPAVPDLLRLARREDEREGSVDVHVHGALGAAGSEAIPQLVAALTSDSWNVRYDAGEALRQIGAPAIPALLRCPPAARLHAVPILQKYARALPSVRRALARWGRSGPVELRLAALHALWLGTRDARSVVPALLELAATSETAAYQLSAVGAAAAFALDEIRALHAKTQSEHLAAAIRKIEKR